ncbi:MAG: hypothetical protein LBP36_04435 [Oscillospiraceae bacterium]|nr:hypothetical protein [Oscillospiraceae bacterium]
MGRPPYDIDVSCIKNGTLVDVHYSFNFILMLNAFTYGFQEINDLSIGAPYDVIAEGGNTHGLLVHKYHNEELSTMTLKRGILIKNSNSEISAAAKALSVALSSWIPGGAARKAAMLGISSLDAGVSLQMGPAIGFIQAFDRTFTQDVVTLSFFSLGVTEWRMNGLDAQSGGLLVEDMTIVHTGLTRMTSELTPSWGGWGVANRIEGASESGYYYDQYFQVGSNVPESYEQSDEEKQEAERRENEMKAQQAAADAAKAADAARRAEIVLKVSKLREEAAKNSNKDLDEKDKKRREELVKEVAASREKLESAKKKFDQAQKKLGAGGNKNAPEGEAMREAEDSVSSAEVSAKSS